MTSASCISSPTPWAGSSTSRTGSRIGGGQFPRKRYASCVVATTRRSFEKRSRSRASAEKREDLVVGLRVHDVSLPQPPAPRGPDPEAHIVELLHGMAVRVDDQRHAVFFRELRVRTVEVRPVRVRVDL